MSDAQSTATTAPAAARDGAAGEVLLEVRDGLGRITLNRPRALNALTQDMVRAIDAALTDWAADPAVPARRGCAPAATSSPCAPPSWPGGSRRPSSSSATSTR